MKQQLNEVQRLQKIAGILKENVNEAPLTINQVVKQLNKIANSKGFYAVDKSKDEKPTQNATGAYNLVKWADEEGGIVELYHTVKGRNVNYKDLEIHFEGGIYGSGNDSVDEWLDPDTWDYTFGEDDMYDDDDEDNDSEDPLYDELANEIGEKTLQKLLSKGWEIDDIAEDPQGAAASLKIK
jgi:hypothetical protein